jgi:hypothetical protein
MTLAGCGGEVRVQGGVVCEEPQPHVAEEVDLRVASPGTFVGDRLHLDAYIDGRRSYVVLEIAGDATYLAAEPELDGLSQLVRVADDLYARVATLQQASVRLDLIDTRSPREPELAASHLMRGVMPDSYESVLGAHEGHAYFCLAAPNTEAALVAVDLGDPFAPGTPRALATSACDERPDLQKHAVAAGPSWVQWTPGEGTFVSQIRSYTLSPTQAQSGFDFGYNPDGVHQYGRAQAVALDGERIVLDPASDNWTLVFEAHGTEGPGPYAAFPFSGPKQLLAVDAHVAFFATTDGVHALDVADVGNPAPIDAFHAATTLNPDEVSLVAIGDRYLAFTDGSARLYVVERSANGPVAPTSTYLGPAPEPASSDPDGC